MATVEKFQPITEMDRQKTLQFWRGLAAIVNMPEVPEVTGMENVPLGPHVIAFNHRGWAEVGVLLRAWPVWPYIMSREENFKIPVLNKAMMRAGIFPVVRDSADMRAIRYSKAILKAGQALAIAIEGTRGRGDTREFAQAKGGAAMLAMMECVPIVPTAIVGSEHYLPLIDEQLKQLKHHPLLALTLINEIAGLRLSRDNPPLRIAVGKPITSHLEGKMEREELTAITDGRIKELVAQTENGRFI